jgi:outer membrane receptor protein involved in Fe transport
LRPQRAETFEIGASRETRVLSYEAALYRTAVREEIDFDPRTFRYVNIGESLHTGVELSARYKAAGVGALALEPFASWAWTRVVAREGENAGRQLKNVPRHIVRVGLAATLAPALRAEAVATAMAGRYLDDANRFSLGDFVTVDLRVERRFRSLAARLDVWNVADARTREIGYALTDFRGRDIPYAYPGARRSLRAGLVLNPGS